MIEMGLQPNAACAEMLEDRERLEQKESQLEAVIKRMFTQDALAVSVVSLIVPVIKG